MLFSYSFVQAEQNVHGFLNLTVISCCCCCHSIPQLNSLGGHPVYYYYWSLLYSAILCSRAGSLHSHVILHEWLAFYSVFFVYPPKYIHWYIDKFIPQGERIAYLGILKPFLLPLHIGSHTASSEDLSPFLESGCHYARSISWPKIVPT